jgi:hypothetical protein
MRVRHGQVRTRTGRLAATSALAVVVVLALVPVILLHRLLIDVLASFHWSLSYIAAELGPWLVLAGSIAFLIPVAISSGLHPESQLYPRARRAYFMWGVVLYLLGGLLVVQMYDVWNYAH